MSKNYVLDAFHNQEESLVPFTVNQHFNTNEFARATKDNNMIETDIKKEAEYVNSVEPDFVKLMDDGFFTYAFNNVENPNDLSSLSKITEINEDNDWLKGQYKVFSNQIKRLDDSKIKLGNIFSAVTLFKWSLLIYNPDLELTDADRLFADLYTKDPEVVTHALRVITNDIKKQIKVQHAAGVSGVLFSTQEIQDDRVNKKFFDNVQKPLDTELIATLNQYFDTSILHICGFAGLFRNHLDWFVDYDLPIVNWAASSEGYTLGEGKKLFNGKVVYGDLGNTTDDVLVKGTEAEIQAEVDKILDEAGTKGVMIGADCTMPRETPHKNIRYAAKAAHTYVARKNKLAQVD